MTASDRERVGDLIQRLVDGEASPAERSELEAIMSTSPSARAEYESFRDLVRRLDTYPMADSPQLKDEVLDALRDSKVVAFHSRERRRAFGLAWAAAATIIVGVAIYQFRSSEVFQPRDAAATMSRGDFSSSPVLAQETSEGTTLTVHVDRDLYKITVGPVQPGMTLLWDAELLKSYDVENNKQGMAAFDAPGTRATVILQRRPDARGVSPLRLESSGRVILKTSISLN